MEKFLTEVINFIFWVLSSFYIAYNFMNSPLFIFSKTREILIKKFKVNTYLFNCYYCSGFWSSLITFLFFEYFPVINMILSVSFLVALLGHFLYQKDNTTSQDIINEMKNKFKEIFKK